MAVDPDRQLVSTFVARRDEESFRALYRAHTPALYRMAWRMGGLSSDAIEEVVQDVWVRASSRLATFRFDAALRTWLIAILIRCVQERRRRAPVDSVPIADDLAGPRATPDLAIDLETAISRLPDGMREVFLLHDVEGLTHEEVGVCLGVTAGTSKSQLFAARQHLRAWLGRTDHGA